MIIEDMVLDVQNQSFAEVVCQLFGGVLHSCQCALVYVIVRHSFRGVADFFCLQTDVRIGT